jgi:hypothetical protein
MKNKRTFEKSKMSFYTRRSAKDQVEEVQKTLSKKNLKLNVKSELRSFKDVSITSATQKETVYDNLLKRNKKLNNLCIYSLSFNLIMHTIEFSMTCQQHPEPVIQYLRSTA